MHISVFLGSVLFPVARPHSCWIVLLAGTAQLVRKSARIEEPCSRLGPGGNGQRKGPQFTEAAR